MVSPNRPLKLACHLAGWDESRPYAEAAFGSFVLDLLLRSGQVEIVEPKRAEAILSLDGRFRRPARGQVTVTAVTDLGCLLARSAFPLPGRLGLQWRVISAALRSHHVLVPSEAVRQALQGCLRLPAKRFTVLEPLPARDLKRASREQVQALQAELGLPPRYFLVTRDRGPGSNLQALEQAWGQARHRLSPDLGLIVAGLGTGTIRGAIDLGPIPEERTVPLLSGARAWLCPSLYEGCAIRALEAMACGSVPVVSARGALPRAVAGAGLVADPAQPAHWAEAIVDLATNSGLHASLTRAGLRAVAERRRHPPSPEGLLAALQAKKA